MYIKFLRAELVLGHVLESNGVVFQPICGEKYINACSYYGNVQ